ncbi:MAG: hypothetical protein ABR587_10225 [Candidatus Binatia bacterium]
MIANSIQTRNGTARGLRTVSLAIALATILVSGASVAQAADSNDRIIPPSPADVAILRGLLALQHPALRQAGAVATIPASVVPTAGTQASQQSGQTS